MKKILVVDDDREVLSVVTTILSETGFKVLTNETGFNIPEIVRDYSPGVILLDIRLPGRSGIEICKELKNIFNIPIILFSAHCDRENALKNSRAEAFIQKPFDLKKFVSLINFYASYQMAEGLQF